jgi:hypothetical protein
MRPTVRNSTRSGDSARTRYSSGDIGLAVGIVSEGSQTVSYDSAEAVIEKWMATPFRDWVDHEGVYVNSIGHMVEHREVSLNDQSLNFFPSP